MEGGSSRSSTTPDPETVLVAREIAHRVQEQIPQLIHQLFQSGFDFQGEDIRLECSLSNGHTDHAKTVRVASTVPLDRAFTTPASPARTPPEEVGPCDPSQPTSTPSDRRILRTRSLPTSPRLKPVDQSVILSPSKRRRKAVSSLRLGPQHPLDTSTSVVRRLDSDNRVFPQRKKPRKSPENPVFQPSTLDKFVTGIWESLYSGMRMDPSEVVEQWQAIESLGQPGLLTGADQSLARRDDSTSQTVFGRMNVLTRKITQTSRTCRSLEVVVQAHWIQCFDERVAELSLTSTREQARRACMAEACVDFCWGEKELRNKMAIWRGYHDIQSAGGWAPLVFAGMGLYRFCKYRVAFNEQTFAILRALQHRFEVAADTLHPRWRQLLRIVGAATQRRYTGHPHDWVVGSSSNEAIPLAETYHQWDPDFEYAHLVDCIIDEEAWGHFDPRTIPESTSTDPPGSTLSTRVSSNDLDSTAFTCQVCSSSQSDDPNLNRCSCFPNLYGCTRAGFIPVQVYRTPNGKNNGLLACANLERGAGIGEFVGLLTSGLENMDVMVGQTERATYQIWQGRQGNHTRFVNHSCKPNSQYDTFVWLGKRRVVLVSKGIEAGEEVTVDYSDMYWKNLDKECLCGEAKCRYQGRRRNRIQPTSTDTQATREEDRITVANVEMNGVHEPT